MGSQNEEHDTLAERWRALREKAKQRLDDGDEGAAIAAEHDLDELLQELQVQQIELKMQNEELRRVQAELAASRDRYASLYNAAPVGYLTLDEQRTVNETNQTACVMLEMDRRRVLTQPIERLVVANDAEACFQCIRRADTTGMASRRELRLARRLAEPLWVQMDVSPALDSTGARCYRVTIADISHQKRAEQVSRRNRELLARIIDGIPVMIAIYDPDLRSFRFNREFRNVLGWTEADASGGDFMVKAYPDIEYRKEVAEFMKAGESGWRDFVVMAKGGTKISSCWSNIHLPDDTWVGIGIDTRERKRSWEELEELNRTLEQRVEQRTEELGATVTKLRAEAARRDLAERVLRDRSDTLRELNAQLEQRTTQLETLTLQLAQAEERQRRRLADVLHDDLQQVLAGAKYQVRMLPDRLANGEDLDEACRAIGALLKRAIRQSRGLSHQLNPPGLDDGCLSAALNWLAGQMKELHGLDVDIEAPESEDPNDGGVRVLAFRAIQEMLFN
ncbi:MAG: PAS domain S-box protein, partial [Phycisphaerae bacterium]|nr:PAS domain S-box protein [Phycisphaerae bacterium]